MKNIFVVSDGQVPSSYPCWDYVTRTFLVLKSDTIDILPNKIFFGIFNNENKPLFAISSMYKPYRENQFERAATFKGANFFANKMSNNEDLIKSLNIFNRIGLDYQLVFLGDAEELENFILFLQAHAVFSDERYLQPIRLDTHTDFTTDKLLEIAGNDPTIQRLKVVKEKNRAN